MNHKQSLDRLLGQLLESVLTQPTAPFRESWTKRATLSYCEQARLPVYEDDTGNMWVGARSLAEARRASLVFVAHLDHPGVVIKKFKRVGSRILAEGLWLGGGPMDIRNMKMKVFSDVNALAVFDAKVKSHKRGPRGATDVLLEIESTVLSRAACTPAGFRALGPWGACLWYADAPQGVKRENGLWVTKAADDLVGACALLEGLRRAGRPRGVVALLTRAEESGFHGTLEVLRKKVLDPRRTLMISVETSSQLPGAEVGKGPVVRLGDRATVFDPGLVTWVAARASELVQTKRGRKKKSDFIFQKRIMDGGTCEATAFNCYGFTVAGISTPLKNYHNIVRGSLRPEPEAVSIRDVEQLTTLIAHLMKSHRASHARGLRGLVFKKFLGQLMQNQRKHARYFTGV